MLFFNSCCFFSLCSTLFALFSFLLFCFAVLQLPFWPLSSSARPVWPWQRTSASASSSPAQNRQLNCTTFRGGVGEGGKQHQSGASLSLSRPLFAAVYLTDTINGRSSSSSGGNRQQFYALSGTPRRGSLWNCCHVWRYCSCLCLVSASASSTFTCLRTRFTDSLASYYV